MNMNRLHLFWAALLLPFAAIAQAPASAETHALLWEIRGPQIKEVSWLFGTIHIIPEGQFDFPEALDSRLRQADRLVLELDMEEAMDPMTQLALLPRMMMPEGVRLSDLLEEEDYNTVMTALSNMGLPGFMMETIKPLFLSALIDPSMSPGEGMESYDLTLFEKAKALGKKHSGLETVEAQLTAFDAIALEDQARMLVEQLRSNEGDDPARTLIQELYHHYKQEDLTALKALMDAQKGIESDYMEPLLYERNRNWIPEISRLMREEQVFFAVGAGHLPGQEGVIQLLREAGYTLTPIRIFTAP
jgi:uncharacterized protein YbaP (TraB family)